MRRKKKKNKNKNTKKNMKNTDKEKRRVDIYANRKKNIKKYRATNKK